MSLDPSQRATLAAAIRADTDPDVVAALAIRNDTELTRLYNLNSAFIVRRVSVDSSEIGPVLNYVAVGALTTINRDRATTFLALNRGEFVPSPDVESYWASTFSGALGGQGETVRNALRDLWRRLATRGEALFATGAGTIDTPGTLGWEGPLSLSNVSDALNENP